MSSKSEVFGFLKSLGSVIGDLSQVSAPSILLNGISMTEFAKYWMFHPELIEQISEEHDETARMLLVCKWYISTLYGSYASRGYELKPYNPVLGERYTATTGKCTIIAEQVSHHPPVTAFEIKCGDLTINGDIQPYTSFKGTYVDIVPRGRVTVTLPNDKYLISLPHLAMRGLYQIRPYFEVLDHVYIVSSSNFRADFEFIAKGYFSGEYNTFKAAVHDPNERRIASLFGNWTNKSYVQLNENTEPELLFDVVACPGGDISVIGSDHPLDTYKVWGGVTNALNAKNYNLATDLKNKIENDQRKLKKERDGTSWTPALLEFKVDKDDTDIGQLVNKIKKISNNEDIPLKDGCYIRRETPL